MLGELEIEEMYIDCFGGLYYIPFVYPIRAKLLINSVEKYYENNVVPFITHESIHYILIREEGDTVSEKFDNLFPENYTSSCLVDCNLGKHLLWRKKFGIKELITEV